MGSALQGQHLHLDCYAGIAGDMFLAALIDLGVPADLIVEGLRGLGLSGYRIQLGQKTHGGIVGCDLRVDVDAGADHPHRRYRDIRELLNRATLAPAVIARAQEMFRRLAVAEGKLHGCDPEAVTFHEVGALDAIVDMVGAALALDYLDPCHVSSRPIPLGSGRVQCAHGTLPVPAPATLELLKGIPVVQQAGPAGEQCTPTGAAIVASIVNTFGPMPAGELVAVGYGAGDRVRDDCPNHLRVLALRTGERLDDAKRVVLIEANIDDMNPEWVGHLTERLLQQGALDVWTTPVTMKKGRPALVVSLLCSEAQRLTLGQLLLSESTSIGLRWNHVQRHVLQRRQVTVETPYGSVMLKEAIDGNAVVNVAPEYETCRVAAERHAVALKIVYQAALSAYANRNGEG